MVAAHLAREQQLARNEALVRAKVEAELDKGARFLEERVAHMFTGFGGFLLNPVAGMAFRTVGREEVIKRAHRQLEIIIAAAKTHRQTPEAIFDGHLTAYLHHDEAYARANRRHPRFPELEGLLREVYVARVEPVSILLHDGLGDSYHDLVRSCFPNRDSAARVLEREFLYAERILVMAEAEHDLLHAPPLVRREVFRVLKEGYAWYRDAVHTSLDAVYAGPTLLPLAETHS